MNLRFADIRDGLAIRMETKFGWRRMETKFALKTKDFAEIRDAYIVFHQFEMPFGIQYLKRIYESNGFQNLSLQLAGRT